MRQARLPSLNADAFLAGELKNDIRHEFVNGVVYAMIQKTEFCRAVGVASCHPARSADNHLSSVPCPLSSERGFTMVEMITVIVILGVLAVVAAPRFFDRNVFDSRGFYDQVKSTVRYAQKSAIAQRRFVCVTFPANNQISLSYGTTNACTDGALASPSGDPYPLVSKNATLSASPNFSFDCLGRPRSMAGGAVCNDTVGILILPTTITVNNYATDIIVERETGYVH